MNRRPWTKFIAQGCCGKMKFALMQYDGATQIVIACPDHGCAIVDGSGLTPITFDPPEAQKLLA